LSLGQIILDVEQFAVGFGEMASCLGQMPLRLQSDRCQRRLLLAHQRLQRNRIARQLVG
jgi:hypothetical protein